MVAFSGGLDSTVLLWQMVLHYGASSCIAVYFDHGLRTESERAAERRIVQQTTSVLGVRLIVRRLPVRAYLSRYGGGVELAGRYLRYALLAHFKTRLRCDAVVTAHHRDDAVESSLMQLGSGARLGLQGMRPHTRWAKTCDVYHPFWKMSKASIRALFAVSGLSHSEDSSNQDTSFLRNHVRQRLLPEALRAFPQFSEKILQFSQWMGQVSDYISAHVPLSLQQFDYGRFEKYGCVNLDGFAALQPLEQEWLARHWLLHHRPKPLSRIQGPSLRFTESHIQAMIAVALKKQPRTSLPGNTMAWHEENNLCFAHGDDVPLCHKAPTFSTACLFVEEGVHDLAAWGFSLRVRRECTTTGMPSDLKKPWVACVSETQLSRGSVIEIRSRKAGDRFQPLGMKGSMSLKRFLIHRKFPEKWRGHLPLFFLGSELVWVPFLGISDRFKLEASRISSEAQVSKKSESFWVFELRLLGDLLRPVFNYYHGM